MPSPVLSKLCENDAALGAADVRELVTRACPAGDYSNKKVLLIVPDATRTAPVDLCFKALHEQLAGRTAAFDVMVALGTHQPMTEEAICERLGISLEERTGRYRSVQFINHEWENPDALISLGTIPSNEISELTGGLFAMDVQVSVNRRLFDYDQIIIIGPVFPHEVVGFSGGNKYLFPGVSGPEVLNFFHWLGAVVTNPMIIGNKWTPVRKVVDRAGAMVSVPKLCFCLVVEARTWRACSPAPRKPRGTRRAISRGSSTSSTRKSRSTPSSRCAPKMYDELWIGGKCMYKLEPVRGRRRRADHLRAAHIQSFSHARPADREDRLPLPRLLPEAVGQVQDIPVGHARALDARARNRHVRERRRAMPRKGDAGHGHPTRNLRNDQSWLPRPGSIAIEDFANREDEGVLLVPKAGEMLYRTARAGSMGAWQTLKRRKYLTRH